MGVCGICSNNFDFAACNVSELCPVCGLFGYVISYRRGQLVEKDSSSCCHVWNRFRNKKFDENAHKSNALRIEAAKKWHPPFCPRCKKSLDDCRADIVRDAVSFVFPHGDRGRAGGQDDAVRAKVKELLEAHRRITDHEAPM